MGDPAKAEGMADVLAEATAFTNDELRRFAVYLLFAHYPPKQADNGFDRCAVCSYTRHPCDVFDLAASVLHLLGEAP